MHRPPLPQDKSLVLIFRGWVNPRAHGSVGGEPRKKSPVTPPGIDPGTVWLVTRCLNHYATAVQWLWFMFILSLSDNFESAQQQQSARNYSYTFTGNQNIYTNNEMPSASHGSAYCVPDSKLQRVKSLREIDVHSSRAKKCSCIYFWEVRFCFIL